MKHPIDRAARRDTREVWRNRRRTIIYIFWTHGWEQKPRLDQAMSNRYWNDCGDLTIGCRNRHCSCCGYRKAQQRIENRRERHRRVEED